MFNISKYKKIEDGTVFYIKFGKVPYNGEIYNYHLGIIFKIPGLNNTLFCVPLTSPKEKHFKTIKDFEKRNYLNIRFFRYHYIKQTDSIALLEQIKTISIDRLNNYYRDEENNIINLNPKELYLLKMKIEKFIKLILHKDKLLIKMSIIQPSN